MSDPPRVVHVNRPSAAIVAKPPRGEAWDLTRCDYCAAECWARPKSEQELAARAEAHGYTLKPACTRCAMQRGLWTSIPELCP